MFKLLFAINESRPSVMVKRVMDELYYRNLWQKARKKAEIELSKNPKPVYKITQNL